ncbi:hypothetical protein ALI144C_33235 [Actinosynnema sp. ALI-1.44]|uniref:condensation domain-containing protein n=1 Tax=Actinosynnema sp. ALI-1.44 TaxID=1933779 RepID=UPI00097BB095|nr:condensation domain-containing protein [Actinosynnema sp. ALI-1.44]ONI76984.1 hypothetical protein ALI144C_33235 [Actinosynnema sp. ALI-1.44]
MTRLLSRIGTVLGATAAIRDVFEAPTPRGLLHRLSKTDRPALARADRSGPLPLSYAQRRLWFLHRLDGPSSAYNIRSVLRLSGELNVPALRRALSDVVEWHESLRTAFTEEAQVVLPDALRATAEHGFDLTGAIPIRAAMFNVADGDHVLLVLMHHIAGDEWSVGPLFSDLGHAYHSGHGESPRSPTVAGIRTPRSGSTAASWMYARIRSNPATPARNPQRRAEGFRGCHGGRRNLAMRRTQSSVAHQIE